MKACERIISNNCVKTHGSFEEALEIALKEIRQAAIDAYAGWQEKAKIHIIVDIERIQ